MRIIIKLADSIKMNSANNVIVLKKLYVIIGILYEENRKKNRENKQDSLNELLSHSEIFSANNFHRTIEDPWKGLFEDVRCIFFLNGIILFSK